MRWLDALAVVVVLAAVGRFVLWPRLHPAAPQAAPPVALATLAGARFDLSRERGKTVLLDFYATWCEPCRASIPLVQRFRRAHGDVVVESIDVGEDRLLAAPFAAQFKLDDVALDPDETAAHAFGITGFPTVVVIDGRGIVRDRWIGEDPQIDTDLAAALPRFRS